MPRPFHPSVVTANHLLDGDVVYLDPQGGWTRRHEEALLIEDEAEVERLLAGAAARAGEVVGCYLADAVRGPDGPEPVHFREAFRARGPSNYPHGKQETV